VKTDSRNNSVSFSNKASPAKPIFKQQRKSDQQDLDPISVHPLPAAKKPAPDKHTFETKMPENSPPPAVNGNVFTQPHHRLFDEDFGFDANEEAIEMKETVATAHLVRRHLQEVQVEGPEAATGRQRHQQRYSDTKKTEETAEPLASTQKAPARRRRTEHLPQARKRAQAHRRARPAIQKR
jgi:hypothetical protein